MYEVNYKGLFKQKDVRNCVFTQKYNVQSWTDLGVSERLNEIGDQSVRNRRKLPYDFVDSSIKPSL